MRSSMPFRKLVSTPKQFGQSTDKKAHKQKHERINSMFQMLQINGKQVLDQVEQKRGSFESLKPSVKVGEFIQKQFKGLQERIKEYCQNQSVQFIQHQKMQKMIMEQKKWNNGQIREEDLINLFFQRLKRFMKQNDLQKIEPEGIKKIDFLSQNQPSCRDSGQEVNGTVAETQHKEKMDTVEVMECNVGCSNKRIKMKSTTDKFYSPNFINNLPISCSSTVSQILFKQAQIKQFSQFHEFCQKILLQSKPIISDVNILKNQQLQKTNSYLNQIYKKLTFLNTQLSQLASFGQISPLIKQLNFHENKKKNIGEEIDYICSILKKINQVHNIDSMFFTCQKPCCQFQSSPNSVQTKAKILMNLKQAAKKSIYYKTQATENYFNRYYNNDKFDMTRVYSLAKTKNEQMQNLEKTYYRNRDKSKPCKKRSQSLYENF